MATLVLQTVGTVIGGLVGGPLGAAMGGALGGALGATTDSMLISSASAPRARRLVHHGPRLKELDGIQATEGAAIPRVYGRARLGGQVIWATRFTEHVSYRVSRTRGGKGGARRQPRQVEVSYSYTADVAIGLCEGPIAAVRRVWADGKPLDLTTVTMRVHRGLADQPADPLILAKQGPGGAPAYRGLAYVVFEALPLENYGNRLPQLVFEVIRPFHGLCERVRAVDIIPAAGERVYEPGFVIVGNGDGLSFHANRHQFTHGADWHASLDMLQALCPNLERVALVVTWFGDDLRAGQCAIRPRTEPGALDGGDWLSAWSVAGLSRSSAPVVSSIDGVASFGGTPADRSVIEAIADLKARGLAVTLYPFVMMDIPAANGRPDPWTGGAHQPAYPWRGRITVDPAPGRPGTAEGTAMAGAQVAAFLGTASASHFTVSGTTITYTGPAQDWGFRRHILHMAALAHAAGGVDALVIGSELIGLTRVRGVGAVTPMAQGLIALAAEAKLLAGPSTKLVYAADWTEYGADVRDGGQTVRFPLDPLFADANIAAVGIDWYPPVTDWRDGELHSDAAQFDGPHDPELFAARIAGGEAFDWWYASDGARIAGTRTPITDGSYGKPWVFRPKDLVGWWSNQHRERVNGVEAGTSTAWVPGMKPIWLMEVGCPAVDRGANQPNVFPDQKSAEGGLPVFSRGGRDDLVQALHLKATLDHFTPGAPGFVAASNPPATAYDGRMVDPARIHLWCWDARPFPAFPEQATVWADGANYATGHWLNGRLEGGPVGDLVAAILTDAGQPLPAPIAVDGFVDGYVIDRPMSLRAALEPLAQLFAFDAITAGGQLSFKRHGARAALTIGADDRAVIDDRPQPQRDRAEAAALPHALTLGYLASDNDYRSAVVRVAMPGPGNRRDAALEVAVAMPRAVAEQRAAILLASLRAARETLIFDLPPTALALTPGDSIRIEEGGLVRRMRIERISDGRHRRVHAVGVQGVVHDAAAPATIDRPALPVAFAGRPRVLSIDLPVAREAPEVLTALAVTSEPWGAGFLLWQRNAAGGFDALQRVPGAAMIGRTLTALPAGPLWRWQHGLTLDVMLPRGALASVGDPAALAGDALIAVEATAGQFEVIGFGTATLIGPQTWRLGHLVRGLGGSEPNAAVARPPGMTCVVLDGALMPVAIGADALGRPLEFRVAPADLDYADAAAVALAVTPGAAALRPLAPVHPRARREATGIRVTWIRRTRMGGDSWDAAEVPLGEEREAYRLEILSGAQPVRVVTLDTPAWLYPAADELADFGAMQASLAVRIRQLSQAAGDGATCTQTVPIIG